MSGINRYTPLPAIEDGKDESSSGETADEKSSTPDIERTDVEKTDEFSDDVVYKIEDISSEMEQRMAMLSTCNDFSSQECLLHIYYFCLVMNQTGHNQNIDCLKPWQLLFCQKFGEKLTTLGFVELYQKMLKRHFNEEFFQLGEGEPLRYTMDLAKGIMWNLTDKSNEICERVIKANLHSDIVEKLSSKILKPNLLNEESRRLVVRGFLSILHNVVRRAPAAREALRECKTVDVLQPFREHEDDRETSFIAIVIQAHLVTEAENEKLNSDIELFKLLVDLLDAAIKREYLYGLSFSVTEVLEVINEMAVNDKNKERIVEAGALPYYVKLIQPDRSEGEQKEAAHGLWILAFKCKEAIKKEPHCVEGKQQVI